ncbi:glycine betaine ABC transporter substrate-binding protein [Malonomonas rubra]|uniref:glycine betaine ABC transporter substrate-binding protein n=1 Tax=Malonomonas rubra TaxID=57040 RepID=UPI0026EC1653|nr:glycine betaine ABC transporter substrate-binding protein [Malonomonas rubra]
MMAWIKKKIVFLFLLFLTTLPVTGFACVGKTLVVGSTGGVQQELLANMLAQLITERTGTSVKLVNHDSSQSAHQALMKDDLDIYVEYTGVGQIEILGGEPINDPELLYEAVKKRYNEELNIVWLKPLGFEANIVDLTLPAQAVPIARKDTLKKFPALARLINKLSGKINARTIAQLEEQTTSQGVKEVARGFLKQNRLI